MGLSLTIVERALADLRPNERNPRRISDERFEALKHSLVTTPSMLEARPLIVRPDGVILAGNMRYRAAQALGWQTIPVVEMDLDDKDALTVALRDNRPYGTDDEDLTAELLYELEQSQADLLPLTGYTDEELERLLESVRGPVTFPVDPDTVPPLPAEPKSKPGEVYELGEHRLMCGDATDAAAVAELMNGILAALVFTDPPYGVGYDGGTKPREMMVGDESSNLYGPGCRMASRFSGPNAPLYLWHAGTETEAAAAAAAAANYKIRCQIIWNKNQAQFGALGAQYKQKHEPCFYCFKPGVGVAWVGPANEVTVWDVDRASANEYHPTQKPVALALRALGNHEALTVLDLFGGSGATLIAAEQLGRKAFIMELEPAYCDVIRQRYADFTGQPELAP